tara:strand:+ start:247 stop:474 length:228 start_codon:yes stop_codon:yes gene_type:complete
VVKGRLISSHSKAVAVQGRIQEIFVRGSMLAARSAAEKFLQNATEIVRRRLFFQFQLFFVLILLPEVCRDYKINR